MAKTTIIEITDDLDGSKNAEEVSFSFRGTDYAVDLGKKNLAALEKALKPYIEAASRVSKGPARKRRSTKTAKTGPDLTAIRDWAKDAGIEVAERGRIPKAVPSSTTPRTTSDREAGPPAVAEPLRTSGDNRHMMSAPRVASAGRCPLGIERWVGSSASALARHSRR